MPWSKKPYIDQLIQYEPGRPIEEVKRALGLKHLIKLASNENPLGTSKKVQKAVRAFLSRIHYYPESSGPLLTKAIAEWLDVSGKQIILGNGSNELIEFLCRCFVSPGDEVVSSACTFLVYPLITRICGGRYIEAPMSKMRYDLEAIRQAVTQKTRLVFIANPNNPTGSYVSKESLERFLKQVPDNVIVCLDEAYIDFVEASDFPNGLEFLKKGYENLIILRTFSKSYGLAGLRIGFGVGHERLIQYLHKVRQPFNVNAVAQTAAIAALNDRVYFQRTRRVISKGRKYLNKECKRLGLSYVPSQANFVLVDLGRSAEPVLRALLRKGLIVRGMKAYNLQSHIRVTIGLPSDNVKFIKSLEAILKGRVPKKE